MNVLSEIPASGRFGPACMAAQRLIPAGAAAYPEQTPRMEPALLQLVAQPAAVQGSVQSVSSLQPGFVPVAGGYTASTRDYAVQLHRSGVSWHGRSGAIRMDFSGASPGQPERPGSCPYPAAGTGHRVPPASESGQCPRLRSLSGGAGGLQPGFWAVTL